ncbi:MAG: ligase-associated DNA damage response endonuclease PdeM [Pseudomonadota bacterium]
MQNALIGIAGETLEARAAGTLWWPAARLLAVGDLHLGKARAIARRNQGFLPPYADDDTLARLEAEVAALSPATILLLGDSFDDHRSAAETGAAIAPAFARMAEGRRLLWIAGNHDPHPVPGLPGDALGEYRAGPLAFRHIAAEQTPPHGEGEISAHYHPQATLFRRGARLRRRCFLASESRAILPAFGTFTGGMDACDPVFDALLGHQASALMIGRRVTRVPRGRLGANMGARVSTPA